MQLLDNFLFFVFFSLPLVFFFSVLCAVRECWVLADNVGRGTGTWKAGKWAGNGNLGTVTRKSLEVGDGDDSEPAAAEGSSRPGTADQSINKAPRFEGLGRVLRYTRVV